MKHIFSGLTALAMLLGLVGIAAAEGTDGQKLLAAAVKRVQAEGAISADLRYKIDAFGHQLLGTGNYLQLGSGDEKLLRLELKMQVGDRPATLQEICGSEFYWIRREVPPAAPMLGRVNLRQLRQALSRSADQRGDVMPNDGWIMLGGLPRLLSSLEKNFAFGTAKADELQFTGSDGRSVQRLPIWTVEGHWKPERLTALAGGEGKKNQAMPDQLPDRVEIVLGRTDDVLPLFPYRFTYWKSASKEAGDGAGEGSARELLSLELFNVYRKGNIDPREFDYNSGDQSFQDLTTAYLQRLGGETKIR